MEFEKKAIRILAGMLDSCEKERYQQQGIGIHEEWIRNPSTFTEYLKGLPGSKYLVKQQLMIRRVNQSLGYIPGNVFLRCPAFKLTLTSEEVANQWHKKRTES